jgi:hypothetical protein
MGQIALYSLFIVDGYICISRQDDDLEHPTKG